MEALLEVQKQTGETPPALRDRPELKEYEGFYLRAFHELSTSRPAGESIGSIPISEYEAYCRLFKIDGLVERERLLKYVSAMDGAYVSFAMERRKEELDRMKAKR